MSPAVASARVVVEPARARGGLGRAAGAPAGPGRDLRRRERVRVVHQVALARGWASRYASRSRVGDTCV